MPRWTVLICAAQLAASVVAQSTVSFSLAKDEMSWNMLNKGRQHEPEQNLRFPEIISDGEDPAGFRTVQGGRPPATTSVSPQILSRLSDRVVDEANLMDEATRIALSNKLADLEKKTTDQLVVVTVNSLQGMSIEDFGLQLGRHSQIGQRDKNNGVLLIVAFNERKVRIEVSYGLALTDVLAMGIIDNTIIPRLSVNDFPGGISSGVDAIISELIRSSSVRNEPQPKAPPQTEAISSGTGFFVSLPGYVLTNQHVIDGCRTATVSRPGYPIGDARIVGADTANDLALLMTDMATKMVPSLRIGARVGENIFVYGFPLSGLLSSSGNFTVGNITSVAGLGDDSRIMQISAPVQPGNSGGPLIDKFGNVVGVVVSKLNALRLAQITQDMPQSINFALKASIAANFLEVNNISARTGSNAEALEVTEIAERAKQFTVEVTCKP
jgi:uncharacterized membrane protein YgcG